jgi:tetratricopeptide (TPR) repeat protein
MNPVHRTYLVNELIRGISAIGPQFELFGQNVTNYLVEEPLIHRGLNAQGHPVGNTIDSYSENGNIAAEYSAEQTYFQKPFKKLIGDFRHVRANHPQATRIYLMSAQECGPKLNTRLTNLRAWIQRRFRITAEVYDARRIAEFIVDDLLLNDEAIQILSPLLAPLERVRNEFAVTNLVPAQNENYLRQDVFINDILQQIRQQRAAGIAGVSGSGKSETAVAVATNLAGEFEIVIWVVATELKHLFELRGLDVERRGRRVNVDTLLKERSCLLVLDDLRLSLTVEQLRPHTNAKSAILVTRQQFYEGDYRIADLNEADASEILQQGIATPCPPEVFAKVKETAAGHPLTLRLMNAGVKQSSWEDLYADCDAVAEYHDEERVQRLADRLLGRLRPSLERELALFLWSGAASLDRSFARRVLAPVGLRKLDAACMLSADRQDVVRLHEVVWSALKGSGIPLHRYVTEFATSMETHIEQLAFIPGEALNFLNFCQLHKQHLHELLRQNPRRSTCLYCLAHAWSDEEIDVVLLPDPKELCSAIQTGATRSDIDASAFCELLECLYRRDKLDYGIDVARGNLAGRLDLYSKVADSKGLSEHGRRTALHHKAKALRNIRRYDEATKLSESIALQFHSPATNLLLARLLLYGNNASVERARSLLLQILEDAKTAPDKAEISVVLASIETLGWGLLNKAIPNALAEALQMYGDLVTEYVTSSAARGFDQAFVSFAAIGRALRYHDEEKFQRVLRSLGRVRPEDARDDKERAAWGNIFLSAGEAQSIDKPEEYLGLALEFYDSIQNPEPFILQQKGHALCRLSRFEEARAVLQPLVDDKPNPWNRYWLSKVLTNSQEFDRALKLLDEALADPKAANFRAALFEQRFEIRKACGEVDAIDDLRKAYEVCNDDKHKGSLGKKLAEIQS